MPAFWEVPAQSVDYSIARLSAYRDERKDFSHDFPRLLRSGKKANRACRPWVRAHRVILHLMSLPWQARKIFHVDGGDEMRTAGLQSSMTRNQAWASMV